MKSPRKVKSPKIKRSKSKKSKKDGNAASIEYTSPAIRAARRELDMKPYKNYNTYDNSNNVDNTTSSNCIIL